MYAILIWVIVCVSDNLYRLCVVWQSRAYTPYAFITALYYTHVYHVPDTTRADNLYRLCVVWYTCVWVRANHTRVIHTTHIQFSTLLCKGASCLSLTSTWLTIYAGPAQGLQGAHVGVGGWGGAATCCPCCGVCRRWEEIILCSSHRHDPVQAGQCGVSLLLLVVVVVVLLLIVCFGFY